MFEAVVEQGKIREFAVATYSTSGDFQGPDAVVPPTFLNALSRLWADEPLDLAEHLGFDVSRTLHGEEEFVFHERLPKAGDTLRVEWRVADRTEKTRKNGETMRLAVVVREFRDRTGVVVAEQRSTLIETAASVTA